MRSRSDGTPQTVEPASVSDAGSRMRRPRLERDGGDSGTGGGGGGSESGSGRRAAERAAGGSGGSARSGGSGAARDGRRDEDGASADLKGRRQDHDRNRNGLDRRERDNAGGDRGLEEASATVAAPRTRTTEAGHSRRRLPPASSSPSTTASTAKAAAAPSRRSDPELGRNELEGESVLARKTSQRNKGAPSEPPSQPSPVTVSPTTRPPRDLSASSTTSERRGRSSKRYDEYLAQRIAAKAKLTLHEEKKNGSTSGATAQSSDAHKDSPSHHHLFNKIDSEHSDTPASSNMKSRDNSKKGNQTHHAQLSQTKQLSAPLSVSKPASISTPSRTRAPASDSSDVDSDLSSSDDNGSPPSPPPRISTPPPVSNPPSKKEGYGVSDKPRRVNEATKPPSPVRKPHTTPSRSESATSSSSNSDIPVPSQPPPPAPKKSKQTLPQKQPQHPPTPITVAAEHSALPRKPVAPTPAPASALAPAPVSAKAVATQDVPASGNAAPAPQRTDTDAAAAQALIAAARKKRFRALTAKRRSCVLMITNPRLRAVVKARAEGTPQRGRFAGIVEVETEAEADVEQGWSEESGVEEVVEVAKKKGSKAKGKGGKGEVKDLSRKKKAKQDSTREVYEAKKEGAGKGRQALEEYDSADAVVPMVQREQKKPARAVDPGDGPAPDALQYPPAGKKGANQNATKIQHPVDSDSDAQVTSAAGKKDAKDRSMEGQQLAANSDSDAQLPPAPTQKKKKKIQPATKLEDKLNSGSFVASAPAKDVAKKFSKKAQPPADNSDSDADSTSTSSRKDSRKPPRARKKVDSSDSDSPAASTSGKSSGKQGANKVASAVMHAAVSDSEAPVAQTSGKATKKASKEAPRVANMEDLAHAGVSHGKKDTKKPSPLGWNGSDSEAPAAPQKYKKGSSKASPTEGFKSTDTEKERGKKTRTEPDSESDGRLPPAEKSVKKRQPSEFSDAEEGTFESASTSKKSIAGMKVDVSLSDAKSSRQKGGKAQPANIKKDVRHVKGLSFSDLEEELDNFMVAASKSKTMDSGDEEEMGRHVVAPLVLQGKSVPSPDSRENEEDRAKGRGASHSPKSSDHEGKTRIRATQNRTSKSEQKFEISSEDEVTVRLPTSKMIAGKSHVQNATDQAAPEDAKSPLAKAGGMSRWKPADSSDSDADGTFSRSRSTKKGAASRESGDMQGRSKPTTHKYPRDNKTGARELVRDAKGFSDDDASSDDDRQDFDVPDKFSAATDSSEDEIANMPAKDALIRRVDTLSSKGSQNAHSPLRQRANYSSDSCSDVDLPSRVPAKQDNQRTVHPVQQRSRHSSDDEMSSTRSPSVKKMLSKTDTAPSSASRRQPSHASSDHESALSPKRSLHRGDPGKSKGKQPPDLPLNASSDEVKESYSLPSSPKRPLHRVDSNKVKQSLEKPSPMPSPPHRGDIRGDDSSEDDAGKRKLSPAIPRPGHNRMSVGSGRGKARTPSLISEADSTRMSMQSLTPSPHPHESNKPPKLRLSHLSQSHTRIPASDEETSDSDADSRKQGRKIAPSPVVLTPKQGSRTNSILSLTTPSPPDVQKTGFFRSLWNGGSKPGVTPSATKEASASNNSKGKDTSDTASTASVETQNHHMPLPSPSGTVQSVDILKTSMDSATSPTISKPVAADPPKRTVLGWIFGGKKQPNDATTGATSIDPTASSEPTVPSEKPKYDSVVSSATSVNSKRDSDSDATSDAPPATKTALQAAKKKLPTSPVPVRSANRKASFSSSDSDIAEDPAVAASRRAQYSDNSDEAPVRKPHGALSPRGGGGGRGALPRQLSGSRRNSSGSREEGPVRSLSRQQSSSRRAGASANSGVGTVRGGANSSTIPEGKKEERREVGRRPAPVRQQHSTVQESRRQGSQSRGGVGVGGGGRGRKHDYNLSGGEESRASYQSSVY